MIGLLLFLSIDIEFWSFIDQYGYLALFILSLLASMSVVMPLPFQTAIYLAGSTQRFNPVFLGIASGAGAALGELSLYLLFRGGRRILPEDLKRRADRFRVLIDRYGALAVFILAVTPLPDDIIYPALGLARYNIGKVFVAAFMGKTILYTVIAYAGFYSYDAVRIYLGGGEDIFVSIILLIISIVFAAAVLMIDWESILSKKIYGEGVDG